MKVESAKYKKTMGGCLRTLERSKEAGGFVNVVSEVSSSSMVPLYAVYLYAMDVLGEEKELIDGFKSICRFYQYQEVLDFDNKVRWLAEKGKEGQYFSKSP